jgi:hypothetical protein
MKVVCAALLVVILAKQDPERRGKMDVSPTPETVRNNVAFMFTTPPPVVDAPRMEGQLPFLRRQHERHLYGGQDWRFLG